MMVKKKFKFRFYIKGSDLYFTEVGYGYFPYDALRDMLRRLNIKEESVRDWYLI